MKKLLTLLLVFTLLLSAFVSCGEEETPDNTQIRIGYMSGPTGMGMAKLIQDNGGTSGNEKYSFKPYENTKLAIADMLANNIDVICLPTNEAADNYNKNKDSVVLSINTLNTLFLISDENNTFSSFDELEGKTIYTCQNGTPKVILEHLLEREGINATVSTKVGDTTILSPKDLGTQLVAGKIDIAVVPEPIVTSSTLQRKQAGKAPYSIDLSLGEIWKDNGDTEITMGCIVANKAFVEAHKSIINNFLLEYKSSIEFISDSKNINSAAEYIVESGIMAALPAAKSALTNLGSAISYIDGSSMKQTLESFYNAIGVTNPDSDFYYNAE